MKIPTWYDRVFVLVVLVAVLQGIAMIAIW